MRQYIITHTTEAVKTLTEHYKEKNTAAGCEVLNDVKTDYNNLFYNMRWNEPKDRFEVVQIGSKQAWVITDTWTGNKYLQSYHTIVSIYFNDTGCIKMLGKWSRTTTRHQSCFYKYCH